MLEHGNAIYTKQDDASPINVTPFQDVWLNLILVSGHERFDPLQL